MGRNAFKKAMKGKWLKDPLVMNLIKKKIKKGNKIIMHKGCKDDSNKRTFWKYGTIYDNQEQNKEAKARNEGEWVTNEGEELGR